MAASAGDETALKCAYQQGNKNHKSLKYILGIWICFLILSAIKVFLYVP